MELNEQLNVLRQDILELYVERKKEMHYEKIGVLEKKIAKKLEFWQKLTTKLKKESKAEQ